jgi:hypothetical protein
MLVEWVHSLLAFAAHGYGTFRRRAASRMPRRGPAGSPKLSRETAGAFG